MMMMVMIVKMMMIAQGLVVVQLSENPSNWVR